MSTTKTDPDQIIADAEQEAKEAENLVHTLEEAVKSGDESVTFDQVKTIDLITRESTQRTADTMGTPTNPTTGEQETYVSTAAGRKHRVPGLVQPPRVRGLGTRAAARSPTSHPVGTPVGHEARTRSRPG